MSALVFALSLSVHGLAPFRLPFPHSSYSSKTSCDKYFFFSSCWGKGKECGKSKGERVGRIHNFVFFEKIWIRAASVFLFVFPLLPHPLFI